MNASSTTPSLTLLALDTATTGCSVCVWRGGEVLAAEAQPMARGQAQELMVMVDRVLKTAGVAPDDLDGVAVTRGPGAFTGLRIALATARGFALALGVPCVGVTTLEALAQGLPQAERGAGNVLVCVESKRDDIYVQLFSKTLEPISEPMAADGAVLHGLLSKSAQVTLVGDAATRARDMLAGCDVALNFSTAAALPDPAIIAALAAARFNDEASSAPEPLYLRPPDAKLPKAQGRMRT